MVYATSIWCKFCELSAHDLLLFPMDVFGTAFRSLAVCLPFTYNSVVHSYAKACLQVHGVLVSMHAPNYPLCTRFA